MGQRWLLLPHALARRRMDAELVELRQLYRRTPRPLGHFRVAELRVIERAGRGSHDERAYIFRLAERVLEAGPAAHRLTDERDLLEVQLIDQRGQVIGIGIRRAIARHRA